MRQTEVQVRVSPGSEPASSLSVTALKRLRRCPLSYWYAYEEGRGAPVSAGAWSMGQIIHGTLRRLFELPPTMRTESALFALVLAEWRVNHPHEHFDELYIARARAAAIFGLMDVPGAHVVGTEVPVARSFGAFQVRGRIDLLYRAPDGARVIADFKSSLRAPRTPLADPMLAMRTYDLLLSQRYLDEAQETILELLVLRPPGVERDIAGGAERDHHLSELQALLRLLADSFETSVWLGRVRPSCRGCAFFDGCPAVVAASKQ